MKTFLLIPALLTVASSLAPAAPEIRASVDPATVPREIAASDKQFLASQSTSTPTPVAEAPSSAPIDSREAANLERSRARTITKSTNDPVVRPEAESRQDGRVSRSEPISPQTRTAQSSESVTVNPTRGTTERRATTRTRVLADATVAEDQALAPSEYVDPRPAVRYVPFDGTLGDDYRDDDRPQRLRGIRIERGIPVEDEVHHEHRIRIGRFFHRLFAD